MTILNPWPASLAALFTGLVISSTNPVFAEVRLPDDPQGRGAQLMFDALAERPAGGYTEADVREAFAPGVIERNGVQRMVMILGMLHEDLFEGGDAEIMGATIEGNQLTVTIAGTHDDARFVLDLSPEHGFKVDGLRVEPAGAGGHGPPPVPSIREIDIPEFVGDFIAERVAEDLFSGAVLIAKDGVPVFAQAYGFADQGAQRENTLDTPINLGSINKMFTGIAVGQLVERGLLDFDDRVGEHLPDFPLIEARDATIAQLLTHTAGLGDYLNAEGFFPEGKDQVGSLSDLIPFIVAGGMVGEPGAMNHYSNSGPVVAGLVLEAVTGQDYYDYVREHIYAPAGMVNSGSFAHEDEGRAGFAIGYHRERPDQAREPDRGWHARIGSAAGGGYASANDMLRLSNALLGDTLLSRDMRETLWLPRAELGPDFGYGYFVGVPTFNEGDIRGVGHNGGAPGVSAEFLIFPELGYTVVVLSNYSRAATPLAEWLFELVAMNGSAD
jgi:CubicO group peptidase (beta-lactamase class C family)